MNKRIGTRELLRNFKDVKALLTSGRVQHIIIDVGNDRELELSLRTSSSSGKNLARMFSSLPKPIHVRRTRIFDELFR